MFRRERSAEDCAEEIKAHLQLEADDLQREGLSEDEVTWKARREFGNRRDNRRDCGGQVDSSRRTASANANPRLLSLPVTITNPTLRGYS
jgi:hypothetical protein